MSATSIPHEQAHRDRSLIDAFVRRGIFETTDFQSFWSQFVGELTCQLHRLPAHDAHLRFKGEIGIQCLRAFLCNFYQDTAEAFYWQPGRCRQAMYHAAMELGVQILPIYPYSRAPDPRHLPDALWNRHYHAANGYFDGVDGYILHSMIRRFRPRRIVEIGSGNSTYLSAQAAARNAEDDADRICEITAIEPYPNAVLQAGFPGLTQLIPSIVQDVPVAEFEALGENDILLIDSSDVLRTGSDVAYEFLEISPRLQKGVFVHVHDLFLPREYPREWVTGMNRYWTEQYLLQALLAFNDSLEVVLPSVTCTRTRRNCWKNRFADSSAMVDGSPVAFGCARSNEATRLSG